MKREILLVIEKYLSIAYPDGIVPEKVKGMVVEIKNCREDSIFELPIFEKKDKGVFSLRLGNVFYPHMKLVVKREGERLLFDVDTHDSPERIPPTLPGYDRFKKVIEFNKRVKDKVLTQLYDQLKENNGVNLVNGKTIVFLDDEDYILSIFTKMASILGLNALSYQNGNKLLKDIEEKSIKPSIAFVDVMMPDISGYDFVKKLIELKLKSFPVVFTTGVSPEKLRKDLCDDYILKPVSIKEIEQKLKRFSIL